MHLGLDHVHRPDLGGGLTVQLVQPLVYRVHGCMELIEADVEVAAGQSLLEALDLHLDRGEDRTDLVGSPRLEAGLEPLNGPVDVAYVALDLGHELLGPSLLVGLDGAAHEAVRLSEGLPRRRELPRSGPEVPLLDVGLGPSQVRPTLTEHTKNRGHVVALTFEAYHGRVEPLQIGVAPLYRDLEAPLGLVEGGLICLLGPLCRLNVLPEDPICVPEVVQGAPCQLSGSLILPAGDQLPRLVEGLNAEPVLGPRRLRYLQVSLKGSLHLLPALLELEHEPLG